MPDNLKIKENLRKYLLGQLVEQDELDLIEERLLKDRDFIQELETAEEELIEDYIFGELDETELKDFKKLFLPVPARAEKIKFTRSLHEVSLRENQSGEQSEKRSFFEKW